MSTKNRVEVYLQKYTSDELIKLIDSLGWALPARALYKDDLIAYIYSESCKYPIFHKCMDMSHEKLVDFIKKYGPNNEMYDKEYDNTALVYIILQKVLGKKI